MTDSVPSSKVCFECFGNVFVISALLKNEDVANQMLSRRCCGVTQVFCRVLYIYMYIYILIFLVI